MLSVTTQPPDKIFSKQDACLLLQSSYDGSPGNRAPDAYTVHVNIYFKEEETPVLCNETCLDDEQQVKMNLSKVLHAALIKRLEKELPDLDNADAIVMDVCCDYRIEYWDSYVDEEGEPQESDPVQITDLRVCYGCVDNECPLPDAYFDEVDGYAGYLPDKCRLGLFQPQYAPYLNCSGSTQNVGVFFKAKTKTGAIVFAATPVTTVEDGQLIALPIGPQALGSFRDPEEIACYTVEVYDAANILTEPKHITVDDCRHACERYLLYYNMFCAPQVVRVIGRSQVSRSVARKIAVYANDCGEEVDSSTRQIQQVDASHSTEIQYRVGNLWSQEVKAIEELTLMNHFYQITRNGYYSMIVESVEDTITKDCQVFHQVAFTAKRAAKQRGLCRDDLRDCENPFYPSIQESVES